MKRAIISILSAVVGLSLASVSQGEVVYQSDFTGTTLASAGLSIDGAQYRAASQWIIDEAADTVKVSFAGGADRATVYTTNSWQNDDGFTLEVTVYHAADATRFSFGLVDASWSVGNLDWVDYKYTTGIGMTMDGSVQAGADALVSTVPGTATVLSTAQGEMAFATVYNVSITVTADSWSYSIDGAAPTTGTHTFDLSKSYRFVSNAHNSGMNGTYFSNITLSTLPPVTWDGSDDTTWTAPDATSWGGGVYHNGAEAQFLGDGSGTVTLSGTIEPGSVTVNSANDYTFSGDAIGGTGTLTKDGTGTLTLTGANTYSGGTTLSNGTLIVENNSAVGSGTLTLDGGTLRTDSIVVTLDEAIDVSGTTALFAGSQNITLSGDISGAGTLDLGGSGSGQGNRYVGITDSLDGFAGTIRFEAASGANKIIFKNGQDTSAKLELSGVSNGDYVGIQYTDATFGELSGTGGKIIAWNDTLTVDQSTDTTYAGVLANANDNNRLALTKDGTGKLTLTGANTYTDPTTVSGGTLQISDGGSLSTSSAVVNDANLIYGTNISTYTYGLSSSITGTGNLTGTAKLLQLNGDITQSGDVSLTSDTIGGLYEKGIELVSDTTITAGSITLTGDLGRSGSNGGNLALDTSATDGDITLDVSIARSGDWYGFSSFTANAGTGNLTVSGANAGSGNWRGPSGATLTGALNISSSFSLAEKLDLTATADSSVTGDLGLINTVNTWTVNPGLTMDVSGVISGTGAAITKNGTGTLALSGANSYSGGTDITDGTVNIQNNEALGTGLIRLGVVAGNTQVLEFGVDALDLSENVMFQNSSGNKMIRLDLAGTTSGTLSGELDIRRDTAGECDIDVGTDDTLTVSGAIVTGAGGGAGLTKLGAGSLILTGTTSYDGATTVNAGPLRMVNSAAGNAIRGLDPAAHPYVLANGATLEFNMITGGDQTIDRFNLTGDGTFKASGTLEIIQTSLGSTVDLGSGALFHVESGIYRFGGSSIGDWSSNLSDMQVDAGATFSGAATPIVVDALDGGGTVQIGGGITVGVDNGSGSFSGVIENSASGGSAFTLSKSGSGTQTLSGANTYSGVTTVNGGALTLEASGALSAGNYEINNGASLQTTVGINISGKTFTFGNSGGGSIAFSGGNMRVGGTTFVTTGGATSFISGTLLDLGSPTYNVADGPDDVDLQVSNSHNRGGIIKSGAGTLRLTSTANNLQSNPIDINAGVLELGEGGRLINGNYSGNITNDGIFRHNSTNDQTLNGIISGAGVLVKDNTSTLTLTGASTYTGDTTISGGTLRLTGSLSESTSVRIASPGKMQLDVDQTVDKLYLDGNLQAAGTWGATGSGATNIDDTHFSGTGILTVSNGPGGTLFKFR
jgi:fibronectin-binding autotransporter adhesin